MDAREAAKLSALQAAVQIGMDDIAAGRFIDVDMDAIEAFIESLGLNAIESQNSIQKAG